MILRSPGELFLLHLLVHPDNHSIDEVIEIAIEKKMVFVGRSYLEKLRDQNVPPAPFFPSDRSHRPSMKFLYEKHIYDLVHPDEVTRQCIEILELPILRSYVEALAIAGVSVEIIRDGIKTRFRKSFYAQAITKYFNFFFDLEFMDQETMMTILDLEVEQLLESKNEDIRKHYKLVKRNARHDVRRLAAQLPGGQITAHALMERFGDWPKLNTRTTVESIESMALLKAATGIATGNNNDVRRAESLMKIASLAHELRQTLVDPGQELMSNFRAFAIATDKPEMRTIDELGGSHTENVTPEEQPGEDGQPDQEEESEEAVA
jgi:hypothetical protein